MQAIINGIRYNTDKATLIGEGSKGYYPGDGDFSSWSASLYVTPRSKRFFLAGEGGAMTMFRTVHSSSSWSGGSRLIPLDKADALEWAEAHLTVDEIEAGFADVIEDA